MAQSHTVARVIAAMVLGTAFSAIPGIAVAGSNEASIEMKALRTSPDRLEIATGTVVVWHNAEPADYPAVSGAHDIVADDGSFTSGPIAIGAQWDHAFLKPGAFGYHCRVHSTVRGDIIVTGQAIEPPKDAPVSISEGSSDPETWGFRPDDVTVNVGDAVVWRNNGTSDHSVTADDGAFDSKTFPPGRTFRFAFSRPGVHRYHCTPHPWMKGVVRVAAPGSSPPAERTRPAPVHRRPALPPTAGRPSSPGPARLDVRVVDSANAPSDWGFAPAAVTIRAGDTIVWHNDGSLLHSVTADGGAFDHALRAGTTWERLFETPGVYRYHCAPHPWMKATVTVVAVAAGIAPASAEPSRPMLTSPPPVDVAREVVQGTATIAASQGGIPAFVTGFIAIAAFGAGALVMALMSALARAVRRSLGQT